jgi:hypothetical protein
MLSRTSSLLLLLCAHRSKRLSASPAPSWPTTALHLEGSYELESCVTVGGLPRRPASCVASNGTVVWDTLGDAAKPGASLLSREKRNYEMSSIAGSIFPGLPSFSELWQTCPSRARNQGSSVTTSPGPPTKPPCTKIPAPCIHRCDPISWAVAACKSWKRGARPMPGPKPGLADEHHRGSDCNFTDGPLPPGDTSLRSFDVWLKGHGGQPGQEILAFVTNVFVTHSSGGVSVKTNNTETVVVTRWTSQPEPGRREEEESLSEISSEVVVFHHCTPAGCQPEIEPADVSFNVSVLLASMTGWSRSVAVV